MITDPTVITVGSYGRGVSYERGTPVGLGRGPVVGHAKRYPVLLSSEVPHVIPRSVCLGMLPEDVRGFQNESTEARCT